MIEIILNPGSIYFWALIVAIIAGAVAVISRPFSTYIKFVYPNAKYEAIGNPYINDKVLNGIIESKNISDFKESINSSKDYKIEGENANQIQGSLDQAFIYTVEMIKKDSSKKMMGFFNIYLEKIDLYLIKKTLRNKILNKLIDENIFDKAILDSSKELLRELNESDYDGLAKILKNYGFYEDTIFLIEDKEANFLKIDNSIDKYIIDRLRKVKVPYKCEAGKQKFVKILIDIINIKNVLRGKQLNYNEEFFKDVYLGEGNEIAPWKYKEISEVESVSQVITSLEGTSYYNFLKDSIEDYNKQNSVQVFENALDCIFLKLIKDISLQNFVTIGPTIRFITSKEFEIRNLKIIVKGVDENLSSDLISNHLIREVS